jgi:hypothetical protein
MKETLHLAAACALLWAAPALSHHAAEGIFDEEIYAMIDSMVANTPHADFEFDDMAVVIADLRRNELQRLLDNGLLD